MRTERANLHRNTTVLSTWTRLWPLFACTAAWGLVTVMLGPLLPALIARWKIQDAEAGTLFTASFLGQLLGAWFATRNLRLSLLGGGGLTVLGLAVLAKVDFHLAHLALFATGIGISAGLTAGNVIAGLSSPHRARTLALFNVSWSAGAIACPALVRLAGSENTQLFFLAASALVLLGALLATTLPRSLTDTSPPDSPSIFPTARLPLLPLLLFAVCMLLYIGNENALGGWLPSLAERSNSQIRSSTIAMLYWLSELISRLAMAVLLYRMSERVLYRASLLLLFLSIVPLMFVSHPTYPVLLGATIISGAAIGPVYPLLIAFLLERFANHAWVGRLFAVASLGGALLPWLTGVVSTYSGRLRFGLLVPAGGVLLMLFLSQAIMESTGSVRSRQE